MKYVWITNELTQILSVLSLKTSVCSILKFCPVFLWVIMSIRSSLLFDILFLIFVGHLAEL